MNNTWSRTTYRTMPHFNTAYKRWPNRAFCTKKKTKSCSLTKRATVSSGYTFRCLVLCFNAIGLPWYTCSPYLTTRMDTLRFLPMISSMIWSNGRFSPCIRKRLSSIISPAPCRPYRMRLPNLLHWALSTLLRVSLRKNKSSSRYQTNID